MSRGAGIAHLMQHGNLDVPCSRYGRDTAECADIAWYIAVHISGTSGNYIDAALLDETMSYVVNDADYIAAIMREIAPYGPGAICDDCGHFAARHDEEGCHGVPEIGRACTHGGGENTGKPCTAMLWRGIRWLNPGIRARWDND
jgi:hypothetical protein